jgi:radical SAM protein with 4Fe4S-binding SPASM domain
MNFAKEKSAPDNIIYKGKKDIEAILRESLTERYGDRYRRYREDYQRYVTNVANGYPFLPDYPLTMVMELVNRCNLNCIMCDQGFRNDAKKVSLDEDILRRMFDEFKMRRLPALILSVSEPLLYKNIKSVFDMAADADIMDVFLVTNGTLLTDKYADMVLNSSVTRLFVSLDAATPETYDVVRPVARGRSEDGRLEEIENNLKNFIRKRDEAGRKLPIVRVSFVLMENNKHELERFIAKWENIVDSIEIQQEVSIEAYDQIKTGVPIKWMRTNENTGPMRCGEPWGQMTVYASGQVSPCCNLVGNKLPIGNIREEAIGSIWIGEAMNNVRAGFLNDTPCNVCKVCMLNTGNQFFAEAKK